MTAPATSPAPALDPPEQDPSAPALATPEPHETATALIERRIRWPIVAVGVFLGMLAALLALASFILFAPAPAIVGLPADPDALAARALVAGLTPVGGGALRFQSALVGADPDARPLTAADAGRVERAAALIGRAAARHPGDARLAVAGAGLDLARRRYTRAESGYRGALYFGAHCPDARLGLGVTLALVAEAESDVNHARALELQAIAQFAAVREGEEPWLAALYDRALLLDQVGRGAEARRWARLYLARDPDGPWSAKLEQALGLAH
jgi:hypothetical protein